MMLLQEDKTMASFYPGSEDTIAAISTALGEAGIGIIRVSGPDAFDVGNRIFRAGKKARRVDLRAMPTHTIHYGFIVDREETVDEVLLSVFHAPSTYTAEDTIEINCHGGIYAQKRCLEAALGAGARTARPGEFTERAFLNGRIDLTRAEAVMDVIQAKSRMSLNASLSQLKGSLYEAIFSLRSRMLERAAFLEAALDDPEHYSLDGFSKQLEQESVSWDREISALLHTFENGKLIREGIHTAIIGKPNAGKSSLLNRLAGKELAIVTEIPGTTRDIVSETLRVGDIILNVEDTAGIREAKDLVEQIGVERAIASAEKADLVLCVLDTSIPLDPWDERILGMLEEKKKIILLNKSDLPPVIREEEIRAIAGETVPVLPVSAKDGEGLEELEQLLRDMFYHGEISFNDEVMITNERQKECLERARQSLHLLNEGLLAGMPEDVCAIDLTDAIEHLGEITGQTVREDLFDEIFGKFCMGK